MPSGGRISGRICGGTEVANDLLRFGAHLDEALQDRFVCGLRSKATQKKLLTEVKLTFKQAVETAQSMEMAAENARSLQNPTRAPRKQPWLQKDVNGVYSAGLQICYRCGKPGHKPTQCLFRTAKCHSCGKIGHLRRACRNPPKRQKSFDPQTDKGKQPVKLVREDSGDESGWLEIKL